MITEDTQLTQMISFDFPSSIMRLTSKKKPKVILGLDDAAPKMIKLELWGTFVGQRPLNLFARVILVGTGSCGWHSDEGLHEVAG
jgi:hypothetical protein